MKVVAQFFASTFLSDVVKPLESYKNCKLAFPIYFNRLIAQAEVIVMFSVGPAPLDYWTSSPAHSAGPSREMDCTYSEGQTGEGFHAHILICGHHHPLPSLL